MGIKTYNPYTPSRRNMTGSDFSEITKTTPEKSLTTSLKKNAGRNNQGKITVRHHGGGNRRKYRIVDFKRNKKDGIPAKVIGIEYNPNRTANIALICYADGEKAYILAPAGLTDGMTIMKRPGQRFVSATAYRLRIFRLVHRCITSSFMQARAGSLCVPQVWLHSLWQRKASTQRFVFRLARCVWFR